MGCLLSTDGKTETETTKVLWRGISHRKTTLGGRLVAGNGGGGIGDHDWRRLDLDWLSYDSTLGLLTN